jgi:FlgD Ig-like domain
MSRRWLGVLAAALLASVPAEAQTGLELRAQGVRAYQALELDAAAQLLRRALAAGDLPDSAVLTTQAYLGATELYRHHADSSRAAFRRLVLLDPRFRLDPVAFPPAVTAAFDSVRLATPAVAVDVPQRVTIEPGRDGITARIYPSAPHVVRVRIETSNGDVLRTLYQRRVTGATSITWDGAGEGGKSLASGLYLWSFASLAPSGDERRIVDVPIRLEHTSVDGPTLPPRPTLLPERTATRSALVPLGVGFGGAALAWLATPLLTDREAPRIAFTVAFSAGGIIGFFAQRPGKPIPENVAANKASLSAWQAEVQQVTDEQRQLRPGPRIIIETGRPSVRR